MTHWEGKEITQRLDRVRVSLNWHEAFERAKCIHIEKEASDHSLLLIDTTLAHRKTEGRFYFDNRWGQNPEVKDLITKAWRVQ